MKRFGCVGLLVLVYLLSLANVVYPFLRLSSQVANYGAFALAQLIPIKIVRLANSWSAGSRWPVLIIGVLYCCRQYRWASAPLDVPRSQFLQIDRSNDVKLYKLASAQCNVCDQRIGHRRGQSR